MWYHLVLLFLSSPYHPLSVINALFLRWKSNGRLNQIRRQKNFIRWCSRTSSLWYSKASFLINCKRWSDFSGIQGWDWNPLLSFFWTKSKCFPWSCFEPARLLFITAIIHGLRNAQTVPPSIFAWKIPPWPQLISSFLNSNKFKNIIYI